jgi:hypothetical protein
MLAIIFRLLESHPDAGRLQVFISRHAAVEFHMYFLIDFISLFQPMFDDIAHMTAALRDRVGHKQAQAHPHYGHR